MQNGPQASQGPSGDPGVQSGLGGDGPQASQGPSRGSEDRPESRGGGNAHNHFSPANSDGNKRIRKALKWLKRKWSAWKIKWLDKDAWQNYGMSVLLVGIAPLLPVLLELLIHRKITEDSLAITAAVYLIALATASNNKFLLVFFLLGGLTEAALYGSVASDPAGGQNLVFKYVGIPINSYSPDQNLYNEIFLILTVSGLASLMSERFNRHVRKREVFLEFDREKERVTERRAV
jgi:hypothetical protein